MSCFLPLCTRKLRVRLFASDSLSYRIIKTLHHSRMAKAGCKDFHFVQTQGDLFTCPKTDSLVHCVSKDLRMGKGIATLFKKKFEGLNELQAQGKDVGDVAVLERDGRFIYYLITKPRYFDKPTYGTLESSLKAMKNHCLKNQVTDLSMPMIGCGLDKLHWNKVSELITEVFRDTAMTVTVYSL